jgi:acyl-CoA synthetase (AMP-forming)/AMP-acid ligase II
MTLKDPTAVAAARFGHEEAIVDGERVVTFVQLEQRVAGLAGLLAADGIGSGDRIAVLTGNSLPWFDGTLAAIRLGATRSYLNERLSAQELQRIIDDLKPAALVVSEHLADRLAELKTDVIKSIIVADSDYERALEHANPVHASGTIPAERIEFIRYTSGTTGRPKGVMHAARARLAWTVTVIAETGMARGESVLHASSLNFAAWGMAYPALHVGARQVVMRKFDADEAVSAMSAYRVAHTVMVPTMIGDVLRSVQRGGSPQSVPALRTIIYGSAPIRPEQLLLAKEVFGDVLLGSYGMSEFNAVTMLAQDEHEADSPLLRSVGRPHLLSDIRITDQDGNELPPGAIGNIEVDGPQKAVGYWRNPELSADLFAPDGWLRTNDLGYLDDKGYLFIVDRKSDLIITGGFNVYPSEVEAVLAGHPAVSEAAVISFPDERWGEKVVAVIWSSAGIDADVSELDRLCRSRLAAYKVPRDYIFSDHPLPKTSNGKFMKKALREQYQDTR